MLADPAVISPVAHCETDAHAVSPLSERRACYDVDGTMTAALPEVWALIRDRTDVPARAYWDCFLASARGRAATDPSALPALIEESRRHAEFKSTRLFSDEFADFVRGLAAHVVDSGVPAHVFVAALHASHEATATLLIDQLSGDPERLHRLVQFVYRASAYEIDLLTSEINAINNLRAAARLRSHGEVMRVEVLDAVESAAECCSRVRAQSRTASDDTRVTASRTAEISTASVQSAEAMNHAARTAAGLIRAIEDARAGVEGTAEIARRAAAEADGAVGIANVLTGQAKAIDSILGLIRTIAGQTNLLALNATIEAARAGDAGRGFAVVAGEVKQLAGQTARATDDIASKIAAIQEAVARMLGASRSIRGSITEVSESANEVGDAMTEQTRIVGAITAAIDETALAADSSASAIADIRAASECVAGRVSSVDADFAEVDERLVSLRSAVLGFVARLQD